MEHRMEHTTVIDIAGMTCQHCVKAVTSEVAKIDGVLDVRVTLDAGAISHVSIASEAPLDPEALRAAIDEAGYDLVGIH